MSIDLVRVLAVLVIALGQILWQANDRGWAAGGQEFKDVREIDFELHGFVTHSYDAIVSEIVKDLVAEDTNIRTFRINERCGSGCLAIFVLDGKKLRSVRAQNWDIRAARRNFLFVPPNTLLIDEYALLELFLSAINDNIALGNYLEMVKRKAGTREGIDLQTGIRINRTAEAFRRAGNLQLLRRRGILPPAAFSVGKIWNEMARTKNKDFSAQLRSVRLAIAFVFFHEFGHFKEQTSGGFDVSWDGLKWLFRSKILNAGARDDEKKADAYATGLYLKYLKRNLRERTPPILALDSANTLVRNFRHIHYIRMFDGLRGFGYRDLFFSLFHEACDEFKTFDPGVRNNPSRQRSVLADLDFLYDAYERDMLLLTHQEYYEVRRKLLQGLSATHPYPASRGADVLQKIVALPEFAGAQKRFGDFFSRELRFIEALRNDEPKKAAPFVDRRSAFDFSIDRVLGELNKVDRTKKAPEPKVVVSPAINCPFGTCSVVTLQMPGDDQPFVYLEVVATRAGAHLVTLRGELVLLNFLQKGVRFTREEMMNKLIKRITFSRILNALLRLNDRESLGLTSAIRMQNALCGASGQIINRGDRTAAVTAMARPDWIAIDVRPSKAKMGPR